MQYCTYLTTYSGQRMPPFYVGSTSTKKITSGYGGSPQSKEFKYLWKVEKRDNPHLFHTVVLSEHATRTEAYIAEVELHKELNVVDDPLYINKMMADGTGKFGAGFKGRKHTEEHKQRMSELNKGRVGYWTGKKRPAQSARMKGEANPNYRGLTSSTDSTSA